MNRRVLLVQMLASLIAPVAIAHEKNAKDKCRKVKDQIKTVQSKMRAGYTRAQGEKLEARLRKLKAERSKYCR